MHQYQIEYHRFILMSATNKRTIY